MQNDEKEFWWYVARRKILKSVLSSLKINKGHVLEVGSGTGGNVALLSEYGDYYGIDKEKLAIDFSEKSHPKHNFKQINVPSELSEINQKFDLIAVFDVIEHVDDDKQTLTQLSHLLNDGGQIVITTPAFPFLWSSHDEVHHHFRRYTKTKLLDLCEDSGLKIKYHSFFNFYLFPVAVMVKLLNKFTRKNKPHKSNISVLLNKLLGGIFGYEAKWLPKHRFPFGVSHLVVLYSQKSNQ